MRCTAVKLPSSGKKRKVARRPRSSADVGKQRYIEGPPGIKGGYLSLLRLADQRKKALPTCAKSKKMSSVQPHPAHWCLAVHWPRLS